MKIDDFKREVWEFYRQDKRNLPWRKTRDPYTILVSEVMLQQTQVSRVLEKFEEWMKEFPTIEKLAAAPLKNTLSLWQGLGYNRRGLNLKRAAEIVTNEHKGKLPTGYNELITLPGIGPYTASAVLAFAHNEPVVMIETNIRAVFLHHFFSDKKDIHDKELLPLIEKTLDHTNSREWYWALMDYGAHLKRTLPNPSRRSRHHTTQSQFKGSRREARAEILRFILTNSPTTYTGILQNTSIGSEWNMKEILEELEKEGFIRKEKNSYIIAK